MFCKWNFQQFLKSSGIKQITSAPYHPSTNGLAEKAIQIVKKGPIMTSQPAQSNLDWEEFWLYIKQLLTVQLEINQPNCYYIGRNLQTRPDLLKPNTAKHIESKQWNQKVLHDNSIPSSSITAGRLVVGLCLWSKPQVDMWLNTQIYWSTLICDKTVKW